MHMFGNYKFKKKGRGGGGRKRKTTRENKYIPYLWEAEGFAPEPRLRDTQYPH